jgi:hypothetical protein
MLGKVPAICHAQPVFRSRLQLVRCNTVFNCNCPAQLQPVHRLLWTQTIARSQGIAFWDEHVPVIQVTDPNILVSNNNFHRKSHRSHTSWQHSNTCCIIMCTLCLLCTIACTLVLSLNGYHACFAMNDNCVTQANSPAISAAACTTTSSTTAPSTGARTSRSCCAA